MSVWPLEQDSGLVSIAVTMKLRLHAAQPKPPTTSASALSPRFVKKVATTNPRMPTPKPIHERATSRRSVCTRQVGGMSLLI